MLARKYEAANERNFYKALDRIEQINATVEETVEEMVEAEETPVEEPEQTAETPEPVETSDELASFFPPAPAVGNRFAVPEKRVDRGLSREGWEASRPDRGRVKPVQAGH